MKEFFRVSFLLLLPFALFGALLWTLATVELASDPRDFQVIQFKDHPGRVAVFTNRIAIRFGGIPAQTEIYQKSDGSISHRITVCAPRRGCVVSNRIANSDEIQLLQQAYPSVDFISTEFHFL